ncbi:MAG: aspartate/glutamate racemase family protein [Hyphomicrobiaceae bacterium]|nr:aspartate/glutamate racemase family protein [Hyphomicrobiaceae bacterium]
MSLPILVINPNSNEEVTAAIDRALDPLRSNDAPPINCITLKDGPFGIESERDVDVAAFCVGAAVEEKANNASALVIACYSDPGLRAAREITPKPVFGIAETGLATAIMLGGRIGVISILEKSVDRHLNYARALGLEGRIVGDLPVNLTVAELANEASVTSRMLDVGRQLRNEHNANVIVLGCAGMARYRQRMEEELEIPVIDPTQAAVAAALSAIRLDYPGRRHVNGA